MFEHSVRLGRILLLQVLFVSLCAWLPVTEVRAGDPYQIAVVPQLPTLEIFKRWQPLARYLTEQAHLPLELKIYSDIPSFEAALHAGTPDFAYLNPYHQVMAKTWQGYIPLVRDSSRDLVGMLVVRADSDIQDLKQLQGRTISFPSPNAFGASLYMRALLHEQYGLEFMPRYARTHANVYRQVLYGDADAGGGVRRTLQTESASIRQQLRVIYETPEVAPHPIAAHPRVPESDRARFTDSLLRLPETEVGRAILASIQMPTPMRASYARDYAPLQSLNLERYTVEPGKPE